ncbi:MULTISPECIES: hypothetical protein [unclassified Pseudoclavibacter]|nr:MULTISPECIES: hypothetical protein [unclassified Pseudoclavibacter]
MRTSTRFTPVIVPAWSLRVAASPSLAPPPDTALDTAAGAS